MSTTIDPEEVAKFGALAGSWWDPEGDFRPLHRLAFIRDEACRRFDRDAAEDRPLAGLAVLDIGCGGGLLAEPLTRLGARVTGIDATEQAVEVARWHAAESGLEIDYRCTTAEDLADEGAAFDLVVNMEVVEHVADVDRFMAASADLVKPGGAMVLATLNRTPKSFLTAIVGAEYVLGWLPRGTHDWRRFLRPSELVRRLRANGLTASEIVGVAYNPLNDRWRRSPDLGVNYMIFAVRD